MREKITERIETVSGGLFGSLKLLAFGLSCGVIVGVIASIFALGINGAASLRAAHPQVIFAMPLAAVVICFFYERFDRSEGTDTILMAARQDEEVPANLAPLIFGSTILSHFVGASVGREGAALQMGGCIGDQMGKTLRMDQKSRSLLVMAGMSAAFSALFGTPPRSRRWRSPISAYCITGRLSPASSPRCRPTILRG